jgi:hypothetical protein
MKRILLAAIATGITMSSFAQTDTTKVVITRGTDTIQIGGVTIIKKEDPDDTTTKNEVSFRRGGGSRKNPNVKTNWWVVDLGFSSFNDNTDYTQTLAAGLTGPGVNEETMELRAGKSINVNIWAFQQKVNLIKHVVNLQYGVGVELNNYRWDNKQVRFQKDPTNMIVLDPSWKDLDKNKLAADYLTVPVMLNLDFTPRGDKHFGLSGGMSVGYLYSARQKIKSGDDKDKIHGDFDLNKWKLSYVGEVSLGFIRLYGSYALNSMWDNKIDHTPYNVGFRLSHW